MKKKSSVKTMILIFLALHTVIVALFVYAIVRGAALPDGPLLAISLIVFSAPVTVYTAYKINRLVSWEIAVAMETVCKLSDCLKAMSEKLQDNAHTIERRALLVNTCASTITELVKEMDSHQDGDLPG